MTEMHSARLNWATPNLEAEIVREARISAPQNESKTATAPRLVSYLIRHGHWSPFQMANLNIEVVTTRDIARQILRHTSFDGVREFSGVQEFSQRYEDPAVMGEPVFREARMQDAKNRQNSAECEDEDMLRWWETAQVAVTGTSRSFYDLALGNGIAKEVARVLLPEGMTPTRLHLNGTVRTWIHFCQVRRGHGTQREAIQVAESIWAIVREQAPTVAAAVQMIEDERAAERAELLELRAVVAQMRGDAA